MKYIDLLLGILSIGYYFYLKIVFGGLSFSQFFVGLGLVLIIYHFTKDKINKNNIIYKISKIIISLGLIVFILVESILILYPKQNISDQCDYLMILGAAVKKTTPSLTLKGRLDKALLYLYETKDDCYIVVSGGKGKGENISEAEAMKLYLVENGIKENRIIIENKSTSTHENFKYSKAKIEEHSNKSVEDLTIKTVTTDFHSFRSFILAKRNGYGKVNFYTSESLNQFVPVYYTREFFATIKTIFLDK